MRIKDFSEIEDYPKSVRKCFEEFCEHAEECGPEECNAAYSAALRKLEFLLGKWLKSWINLEFEDGSDCHSLMLAMRRNVRRVRGEAATNPK